MRSDLSGSPSPVADALLIDLVQPITVNLKTARRISGLGRSTICEAMYAGAIATLKVGKRRLLVYESLRDWLLSQPAPTRPVEPAKPRRGKKPQPSTALRKQRGAGS